MGKHYDKCSCIKMQSEETITSNYENNNLIETNVNSENNKKPKLKFFNGIFNKIFQKNKNEILIQSIFRGFIFRKTDFQTIKDELIKEETKYIEEIKNKYITKRIKELNSHFKENFSTENYKIYFPEENIQKPDFKIENEYPLFSKCLIKNFNNQNYLYIGQVNYNYDLNGYGELYSEKNEKFEGIFLKNNLNGWGRHIDKSGICYEGNFINSILTGKGISFQNTKKSSEYFFYEGNFLNFKKDGFGKEETEEFYYEGNYKNNKKNGKGKITYKIIEDNYTGEFLDDEITGYGFYQWQNKHTYEGNFLNGKMDGKGIYKWPEGGEYNGDYVNGIKEGFGIFKWTDGKIFEGPFGNGKPNGKGKLTIGNVTINATFINGKFIGNLKEILKEKNNEDDDEEIKEESISSLNSA